MNRGSQEDTIVALSTPLGRGAIALVRLSGPRSGEIVGRMIGRPLDPSQERKALFARIGNGRAGDDLVDQVVVTYYCQPRSYTGEDMVEIGCHCNPLIIDRLIQLAVDNGARLARPGEFTLRAFLNQKLDLSQAEAVAEVIHARTRQSLNQSLRHLDGKLSRRIHQIRDEVLGYLALMEINLDFSDEDIEAVSYPELQRRVEATRDQLENLLSTYHYGRLLQEGIKLLLLGKPNVGKSSLLNALLGQERSIVSEIPGTTRDYIEAGLELDGLYVQAVDTAGVRRTGDVVEAIGVQRTLEQLGQADVALALFSAAEPPDADDEALLEIVAAHRQEVQFVLVA
ncbi:MAG: tRNA uridine-5-carboxymethylaminomethyl(34) synthesis GTPase MnmE, partial [Calditrichaeota bacterium]